MASTTIHTLSYKMVADTRQFSAGLLATKSEVQLLKKILGDTTPEQKAADAITRLDKLYEKGKITAEQHAKALKGIKTELHQMQLASSSVDKAITKMQSSMVKAAKWTAGAAVAGASFLGFSAVREIESIKQIADAAEDLQMPFNELVKLQQAFVRGGELTADSTVPALRAMNQNIQMSARDMGKFKALAGELGLEMDTMAALSKMPVLEQFRIIVDQISKMPDQGGRGLIVKKLFGIDDAKFTTLMSSGLANLDKIGASAEKFGITLADDSSAAIGKLVSQTEQLSDKWTGLIRKLAVELTPWLDSAVKAIETINRWLNSTGTMDTPAAITGPGGKVGPIDPALMFTGRTPAEYAMLRNFSNSAKRINPSFNVRNALMADPNPMTPSGMSAITLQQITSESFRTGNVAQDEEILKVLLQQLTSSLRRAAEAQEQANEQRNREQAAIN